MKTYWIERHGPGNVTCEVEERYQGKLMRKRSLPHLMKHSPDGFEFGYGGSGPSDLARSIVGDVLNLSYPDPKFYHEVKFKLIAPLEGDGPHCIEEVEVLEALTGAGWEKAVGRLADVVNDTISSLREIAVDDPTLTPRLRDRLERMANRLENAWPT